MNYLDLFHGIGGFALGAYWAGMKFENYFCSDIEPYAVELYKKRFPDSEQLGDITKINWEKFPFPPGKINAVILTHAHLDHCGLLPKLVREGFKGPIYCTEATAEIAKIILLDAAKLQEELSEAQIVDSNTVSIDTISFYTKVVLDNKLTNKTEEYIILGPWESEPAKNIISYLSPLGTNLMNKKINEKLQFKINQKEFQYVVKNIEKAIL